MKKTWITLLGILSIGTLGLGYALLAGFGAAVPQLSATSGADTASAIRGTYSWRSGGKAVHADSDHPVNFVYEAENVLEAVQGEAVLLTPMAGGRTAALAFTLDSLEVFDAEGSPQSGLVLEEEVSEGSVAFQAPESSGTYTVVLVLTFDRGTVSYGLRLRTEQGVPMKGLELYLWKDADYGGRVRFNLLTGTNRNKSEAEVRDPDQSDEAVEEIRRKLSGYPEGTEVFIYRADAFTEAEFRDIFGTLTKDLPQTFHDVGQWRR